MTIKLVGSSSGSVSLQAPASTTGGANRVLTLPDVNGTVATTTTAGKILQVVNTLFTTPVTSTSNAYVNISGFEASITPSATTSKVLIMISVFNSTRNATTTKFKIVRSVGGSDTDLRTHTGGEDDHMFACQVNAQTMTTTSYTHLDSPSTTSAITYKIHWKGDQTQLKAINRYDDSESYQGNSTITLMEVAA